jgi:two-component system, NtrC family, sensor kinase
MFLSRDNLPASTANWVDRCGKIHKSIVKRTRQLKGPNHELANQIAECRRMEEALRQAEQKYRSIFENAVEGIFQTTPDGRYQACNPALARLYGYESPDELLATLTNIGRQLYVEPHRRDEFIDQLRSCDAVSEFESQVYRKDGSMIWISENARAVRDENGTLLYYEGFVTDITQRKLAEASLRQSEAQLRGKTEELEHALSELQRTQTQLIQNEKMSSLGQLVAGVAHEINNPVNFLCNNLIYASQYAEDLLNLLQLYAKHYPDPMPEVQQEAEAIELEFLIEDFPKTLSSMQLGADRIRQIVQSLRNFSRIDEAQMTSVDLHEAIDSTLLILQNRLKAKGDNPGITLIKEYTELPLVECYPSLLNQVLMNLLCNAIDALEEGTQKRYISDRTEDSCDRKMSEVSATQTLVSVQTYGVQQSFNPTDAKELGSRTITQDLGRSPDSLPLCYHSQVTASEVSLAAKDRDVILGDGDIARPHTILIRTEVRSAFEGDCLPLESSTAGSLDAMPSVLGEAQFASPCGDIARYSPNANGNTSPQRDNSGSPSTLWAVVRIIDNGLGIAEDVKERIFDPFFTTKPLGKGTGLGLSICHQIVVEKHGGQLRCFSAPNQGTEFVIAIPIQQKRRD